MSSLTTKEKFKIHLIRNNLPDDFLIIAEVCPKLFERFTYDQIIGAAVPLFDDLQTKQKTTFIKGIIFDAVRVDTVNRNFSRLHESIDFHLTNSYRDILNREISIRLLRSLKG